jgi:hypothetical protein
VFLNDSDRNARPVGERGGGGGRGGAVDPPTPPEGMPNNKQCIRLSDGPVDITGGGLMLVLLGGGSFSVATFTIPSTGESGVVTSGSGNVGFEGFAGAFRGRFDTVGDLLGKGFQSSFALPVPGAGVTLFSPNASGKPITGKIFAFGVGGGASAARVGTRLASSSKPICP